ncbi:DinB family protein [Candidimonas sp. SYP-B2681]|uniref:DinB family protein n=1 Tax=Candidimonas sp. SYP-B2681 TaxID=2497686 RepID=UPI0018F698D8|nr:DinB family protein [Candidimonas sp. SYP-B2681]
MYPCSAITPHLYMLAGYHHWANVLLLKEVASVSDDDYFSSVGLYFGSIHGTLNHMLLGDRSWHGRFVNKPEAFLSLAQEVEADRHALAGQIIDRQNVWHTLIDSTSDQVMAGELQYRTTANEPATTPWIGTLIHVFNHASHHRGQISAALTGLGYNSPEMDLIYFLRT